VKHFIFILNGESNLVKKLLLLYYKNTTRKFNYN